MTKIIERNTALTEIATINNQSAIAVIQNILRIKIILNIITGLSSKGTIMAVTEDKVAATKITKTIDGIVTVRKAIKIGMRIIKNKKDVTIDLKGITNEQTKY